MACFVCESGIHDWPSSQTVSQAFMTDQVLRGKVDSSEYFIHVLEVCGRDRKW